MSILLLFRFTFSQITYFNSFLFLLCILILQLFKIAFKSKLSNFYVFLVLFLKLQSSPIFYKIAGRSSKSKITKPCHFFSRSRCPVLIGSDAHLSAIKATQWQWISHVFPFTKWQLINKETHSLSCQLQIKTEKASTFINGVNLTFSRNRNYTNSSYFSWILSDSLKNHHHWINIFAIQGANSPKANSSTDHEDTVRKTKKKERQWRFKPAKKTIKQETSKNTGLFPDSKPNHIASEIEVFQRISPLKVSTKTSGKTQNLLSTNKIIV